MSELEPATDILRLFREDLDAKARVDAFKIASEQQTEQLQAIATPENVARINDNFELHFVFNSHGDAVNVGQSLHAIGNPLITFVENAGDAEIRESGLFGASLTNAFDINFNSATPISPIYSPANKYDFGYWRDRGLLAKGSVIAPVDIRHYSRRLLDALMGNDYDQQYLNRSIPGIEIRSKDLEKLIEEQGQRGLLVMYSNAVRELTSTKQVVETLLQFLDTEVGSHDFDPSSSDKVRALMQKTRLEAGKIPVGIIYGTGHHAMVHAYRKLGISYSRTFPGAVDAPAGLVSVSSVLDQFFSSHVFGIDEATTKKYASQLVLEGMLWEPIDNTLEYGLFPADRDTTISLWGKITKAARNKDTLANLESIHQDFQQNPKSVVRLLEEAGIHLVSV